MQMLKHSSEEIGKLLIRNFFVSVILILLVTGLGKLYSTLGAADILALKDPLFGVKLRVLLRVVGLLEIGVASYLAGLLATRGTSAYGRCAKITLWLSGNFACYRFGLYWMGVTFCPCPGVLTSKLPFTPRQIS